MFGNQLTRREWLCQARGVWGYLTAATLWGTTDFARASPTDGVRIAHVGDSMIDGIWGGLVRSVSKEPCLKPRINLGRYGENGTGLARADKYDWAEQVSAIIADFQPHLMIVSLGLNDRQGVVDASGKVRSAYNSPDWSRTYSEVVIRFLHNASTTPAGLLWIGIPAMRDKAMQADAKEKNQLYAEAVRSFGDQKISFVQPWRQNGSDDNFFQAFGPDASGSRIQIRAPDGIHFTPSGYDMVAAYLLPKIIENLKASKIEIQYPCLK